MDRVCPKIRAEGIMGVFRQAAGKEYAMDRLLTMDKEQFITQMLEEARRTFGQVADAVNGAADGNVINGSEMQVRDAMVELQRRAFEKAVQMRIDPTESSFSPSGGQSVRGQTEQGPLAAQRPERQRAD
jgi:hypothetical protein